MGNITQKIKKLFSSISWGNKQARVFIAGLDAAGKTTLLYKLKLGEVVNSIPTIGFNVETIELPYLKLQCWDLGGGDKLWPLQVHYFQELEGYIRVIDITDKERIQNTKDWLEFGMNSDKFPMNIPILIFANKNDIKDKETLSQMEIVQHLELEKIKHHPWKIVSCSALTGDGLYEGFEWLSDQINIYRQNK